MKLFTLSFVLFILGPLLAYAETPKETSINWASSKEIKDHIVLTLESKKGEVAYGPNFALSNDALGENFSEIYLVRSTNLDDDEQYTLYITALYNDDDWRNYTGAASAGGDKLPLVTLSKTGPTCNDTVTCKYEEELAVSMDFFDVVDAMTSSFQLTLTGNRTDHIKIPGSYFRAIMQTILAE